MAYDPIWRRTFNADGDLSLKQWYVAKRSTASTDVAIAGVADEPVGIIETPAADNLAVGIIAAGSTHVITGAGGIAAGARLGVDSSGRAVTYDAATHSFCIGTAEEASTTSGELIEMTVNIRATALDQQDLTDLLATLAGDGDGEAGADLIGLTPVAGVGSAATDTVQEFAEALVTLLKAVTDSASGADFVGVTPLTETGEANSVQEVLEALVALLKAVTDSAAGADLIGATAITEAGAATTVQGILEGLVARLKATTDSASGADLIAITAVATLGAAATVQAAIEALATQIGDITTLETDAKQSVVAAINELHT